MKNKIKITVCILLCVMILPVISAHAGTDRTDNTSDASAYAGTDVSEEADDSIHAVTDKTDRETDKKYSRTVVPLERNGIDLHLTRTLLSGTKPQREIPAAFANSVYRIKRKIRNAVFPDKTHFKYRLKTGSYAC